MIVYDQYIVWTPKGSNPTRIHESREEAVAECRRLASVNPGKVFYVAPLVYAAEGCVHVEASRLGVESY